MEIKTSIITPSRDRTKLLGELVYSIFSLAKNPRCVEHFIITDRDDVVSTQYVANLKNTNPSWNIIPIVIYRTDNMCEDYYNMCSRLSSGKYMWGLTDDTEILTKDWDVLLEERAEKFLLDKPDRIAYIHINDGTKAGLHEFCCFPILTKEVRDTMGGILPKEINSWGADIALFNLFKSLSSPRICDAYDLKVAHKCHHNNTIPRDAVNIHIENISHNMDLSHEDMLRYIKNLNSQIEKHTHV